MILFTTRDKFPSDAYAIYGETNQPTIALYDANNAIRIRHLNQFQSTILDAHTREKHIYVDVAISSCVNVHTQTIPQHILRKRKSLIYILSDRFYL